LALESDVIGNIRDGTSENGKHIRINGTVFRSEEDRVGIFSSGQVVNSKSKGAVCQQGKFMRRFHVKGHVKSEIIRNAVAVTISVHKPPASGIVIRSHRHGNGPAGAVIHINRQAEPVCEFEISHQFQIVRFVVWSRVPVTVVHGTQNTGIVLAQFGS